MSPADAAKLLELPADATAEQLEARFLELRRKLEDKIAKAPTPGLQAKYRESLTEITTAFETLTLAADSSSLPVTRKQRTDDRGQKTAIPKVGSPLAGGPDSGLRSQVSGFPPAKRAKSSKEFVIVALIALALLGAGGWFVLKTRAENAEMTRVVEETRLAAEARVAAEKKDAEARVEAEKTAQARKAEETRQTEGAEKIRAAAEAERANKLVASLRSQLAELKITWDATDQGARTAERLLGELRASERELSRVAPTPALARMRAELGAQEEFTRWLAEQLPRHPARIALVQAEGLLSAGVLDEAQVAAARCRSEIAKLDAAIAEMRRNLFQFTSALAIEVDPPEASWEVVDAYGEIHRGNGPFTLPEIPYGSAKVTFKLAGYLERIATTTVTRQPGAKFTAKFTHPRARFGSVPAGAEVILDGRAIGRTPLDWEFTAPCAYQLEFRIAGHPPQRFSATANETVVSEVAASFLTEVSGVSGLYFLRRQDGEMGISAVETHTPAEKAGLVVGDIIAAVTHDGAWKTTPEMALHEVLATLVGSPGDTVRLKVRPADAPTTTREVAIIFESVASIRAAQNQSATVYFYRPIGFVGSAVPYWVTLNGQTQSVWIGGHAKFQVPAGPHRVKISGLSDWDITLPRDSVSYVKMTYNGANFVAEQDGKRAVGAK